MNFHVIRSHRKCPVSSLAVFKPQIIPTTSESMSHQALSEAWFYAPPKPQSQLCRQLSYQGRNVRLKETVKDSLEVTGSWSESGFQLRAPNSKEQFLT